MLDDQTKVPATLQKVIEDLEWYFEDETKSIGQLQATLATLTKRQDGTAIRASIRNCEGHKKLIGKALGNLAVVAMSRGEKIVSKNLIVTDTGEMVEI